MSYRVKKVQDLLNTSSLDAILISDPHDIIYLTGFSNFSSLEREAFLLITPQTNYLITDGRYTEAVTEQVKDFHILERSSDHSLNDIFTELIEKHNIHTTGFDEQNLSVAEYSAMKKIFKKMLPLSVESIRVYKTTGEIHAIRKACQIGDKAFSYIIEKLKEKITEKEIAFELEYYIKKHGADLSFPSIVAFGKNSSVPHHQTGDTKLKKNDFVLFDFGVTYNNYCSDMTRTIVFGKANEKQKKIHQTVLDAQRKAIDYLNHELRIKNHDKGIKGSATDKIARDHIVSHGYSTIPHSLGHGIGIEVHEAPRLSPTSEEILEEGMVFSIEPGIYLPGFGGVRIEDLFAIQNNKLLQLTNSPKDLLEI